VYRTSLLLGRNRALLASPLLRLALLKKRLRDQDVILSRDGGAMHGQRLLYAGAQGVSQNADILITPEGTYDVEAMLSY
jgi:hypothetical protein